MIDLIKIELLKTKRSLALLMMFVCPLMVVLVNVMVLLNSDAQLLTEKTWEVFWLSNYGMWGYFMMPLYIALVTALLNGVEHKSNGWRYLATLPVSQSKIFLAKFILAWFYLIGASLVLFFSIYLSITVLSWVGYDGGQILRTSVILKIIYACIASLAILTIQHIVSWRWQNIIAPLGLGVLATFSLIQFSSSKYWMYNPWTYTLMTTNAANVNNQAQALISSITITILLLIIGFYWSKKREITC